MLDFVAEHPWACLLLLIVFLVSVEFVVNRENWKKRSAEITVTFVGVFAAIVFALAQGKYDREQEGRDKAITLFKAAEIELSAVMAENDIYPPDDSASEDEPSETQPSYTGEKAAKMINRLRDELKKKDAQKEPTQFPVYEALMKEPEILSRFPHHIIYLLSSDYQRLQSLVQIRDIYNSVSSPVYFGDKPDDDDGKIKENKEFAESLGFYLGSQIWRKFADAGYTFCALRTSIEIEKEFEYRTDDYDFWIEQLKKSCGDAKGLPNMGPGNQPYVEALVEVLKNGPH